MQRLLFALGVLSLASLTRAADPAPHSGSFHGLAGLQLYSLRDAFKTDGVPATLDRVKAFGFSEVETAGTYGLPPEEFKKELEARGLQPISGHFQYDALAKDTAAVAREAKTLTRDFHDHLRAANARRAHLLVTATVPTSWHP